MPNEEIRQIAYLGDGSLTCWLENACGDDPLIFPCWPYDFPKHVAVYLSDTDELAVALSRRAMLAARDPNRLWFCNISLSDLCINTDAQASWFKGGY